MLTFRLQVVIEIPEFMGFDDPVWPVRAYILTSLKSSSDNYQKQFRCNKIKKEKAKVIAKVKAKANTSMDADIEEAIGEIGNMTIDDSKLYAILTVLSGVRN